MATTGEVVMVDGGGCGCRWPPEASFDLSRADPFRMVLVVAVAVNYSAGSARALVVH